MFIDALVSLHSLLRWLILAIGVLVVLRGLRGWLTDLTFARSDNALGAAFTGLIDVNVLIGAVLLAAEWSKPDRPSPLHLVFTIMAAGVAHVGRVLTRRRPNRGQHQWQSLSVLLSLVLVLIGITFM